MPKHDKRSRATKVPKIEQHIEMRLRGLKIGAFGRALKKYLLEDETNRDFAARIGVQPGQCSEYLNGEVVPTAKTLRRISERLDIHPDMLTPTEDIDWKQSRTGHRKGPKKWDLTDMDPNSAEMFLSPGQYKRWQKIQEVKLEEQKTARNEQYDNLNHRKLIEENLYIRPEAGGLIPFEFWRLQGEITEYIENNRRNHRPTKGLVIKPRREGMTSELEGNVFILCHQIPYRNALIMSSTADNTLNNHTMIDIFYQNLSDEEKEAKPAKLTQDSLVYAHPHGSRIHSKTAGAKSIGLGWAFNDALCDEAAFWENPLKTWEYVGACIAKPEVTWDTNWWVFTTPNGMDLLVYPLYLQCLEEGSDWKLFFHSWAKAKENRHPLLEGEVLEYSPAEQAYKDENELDDEQMKWARWVRRNECLDSWDIFHRKYPVSAKYAFIGSGDQCFDLAIIDEMLKEANKPENQPIFKGRIEFGAVNKISPELIEDPFGHFSIWEHPQRGLKYAVVVDPSLGQSRDFAEIGVTRVDSGRIVAHFRSNTIKPDALAHKAYLVAVYYNWALLCIESIADVTTVTYCHNGFSVKITADNGNVTWLQVPAYPALHHHRRYDKKIPDESGRLGFVLSPGMRRQVVSRLATAVSNREFWTPSVPMLLQMRNFTWDNEKKIFRMGYKDPLTGLEHDDGIALAGMSNEMILGYDKYMENVPKIEVVNY